jgi:hypothetical protein
METNSDGGGDVLVLDGGVSTALSWKAARSGVETLACSRGVVVESESDEPDR